MNFAIATTPGASSAKINIAGDFSALEIEQLIDDLGKARGMMLPSVPRDPEEIHDFQTEGTLDPRFYVNEALDRAGAVLRIRHGGLGWLTFWLPHKEAAALAQLLDQWSKPR